MFSGRKQRCEVLIKLRGLVRQKGLPIPDKGLTALHLARLGSVLVTVLHQTSLTV